MFRSDYRLYSGAFVDVVYDHFLANDENEFENEKQLLRFSQNTYKTIEEQQAWLALPFAGMFLYMKTQNWLLGYRSRAVIIQSFSELVRRAAYL